MFTIYFKKRNEIIKNTVNELHRQLDSRFDKFENKLNNKK
jgi:hypothetical protein